ncbi:MAG: hypothetical protein WC471_03425 [Candidatus Woesearchaeota archaeon]
MRIYAYQKEKIAQLTKGQTIYIPYRKDLDPFSVKVIKAVYLYVGGDQMNGYVFNLKFEGDDKPDEWISFICTEEVEALDECYNMLNSILHSNIVVIKWHDTEVLSLTDKNNQILRNMQEILSRLRKLSQHPE